MITVVQHSGLEHELGIFFMATLMCIPSVLHMQFAQPWQSSSSLGCLNNLFLGLVLQLLRALFLFPSRVAPSEKNQLFFLKCDLSKNEWLPGPEALATPQGAWVTGCWWSTICAGNLPVRLFLNTELPIFWKIGRPMPKNTVEEVKQLTCNTTRLSPTSSWASLHPPF